MDSEYDQHLEQQAWKKKGEFFLAKVLKGIFWIMTLCVKIVVEVIKGVLRVFRLPVPGN